MTWQVSLAIVISMGFCAIIALLAHLGWMELRGRMTLRRIVALDDLRRQYHMYQFILFMAPNRRRLWRIGDDESLSSDDLGYIENLREYAKRMDPEIAEDYRKVVEYANRTVDVGEDAALGMAMRNLIDFSRIRCGVLRRRISSMEWKLNRGVKGG